VFLRRVDSPVDANISEEHSVSIFRAEALEPVCFSETMASTGEATRRQNPEEHHHPHRRENLKSYIVLFVSVRNYRPLKTKLNYLYCEASQMPSQK
jgi:hypothetical protein